MSAVEVLVAVPPAAACEACSLSGVCDGEAAYSPPRPAACRYDGEYDGEGEWDGECEVVVA